MALVLINGFIFVFLLFLWCWDYPADHPAKRFIQKFSFPFVYMGLWHGWAMFAPEPIHVNRRMRAVLMFADGVTENWSPLGPDSHNKLINLLYARSFKYEHSLLGPRVLHLYVPLCEFLMRQVQSDGRKLLRIEFMRDFQYVNPYGAGSVYSELKSVAFYRYDAVKQTGFVIPVTPASGERQPSGTNTVRRAGA